MGFCVCLEINKFRCLSHLILSKVGSIKEDAKLTNMETDIEEMNDENSKHSRAPNYERKEISALLDLVEKYKHIVLNKSITGPAKRAKDNAWIKIAKEFNQMNLPHHRNAGILRNKWINLKKRGTQLGKSLNDNDIVDEQLKRAFTLSYEADSIQDINIAYESEKELQVEEDSKTRVQRSLNFIPQECKLLLNLIKEEKEILSLKTIHIREKRRAWMRIAKKFNKHNYRKRTRKTLMTKFQNMKNQAKSLKAADFGKYIGKKEHQRLEDDVVVKQERFHEDNSDLESIDNDDVFNSVDIKSTSCVAPDPLFTVLNGDVTNNGFTNSDYGRNIVQVPVALSNDKEVKEKMLQLLNYQMKTAKFERKRILDQIKCESSLRESRELEQSLRLRAARLEVVAAESKFPKAHPALKYTRDEQLAELHMKTVSN